MTNEFGELVEELLEALRQPLVFQALLLLTCLLAARLLAFILAGA